MLTLITPTGDRHEAFKRCQELMRRQHWDFPVHWIIIDDGVKTQNVDFKRDGWHLTIIRLLPDIDHNTQQRNLLEGLNEVADDARLILIEDDDYYDPQYLDVCNARLDRFDLVGERVARYYNIASKRWKLFAENRHSSLCATAMKGKALQHFKNMLLEHATLIDMKLWQTFVGPKYLFDQSYVVGIKGMEGRKGIGIGHQPTFGDPDRTCVLERWLGRDAALYQSR